MKEEVIVFIIILVLGLRQLREKRVSGFRIWILPVLMLLGTAQAIVSDWNLSVFAPPVLIAGFAAGSLLGIVRGKLTQVKGDATGRVTMKGSMAGFLIWVAIYFIEVLVRQFGSGVQLLAGFLLMASLGSVMLRRIWIYAAYRKEAAKWAGSRR
ncbi:CcdC protein domain-containing protein [Paenibacillus humicola]|uniref:CcdC protein domain-containing protein n=1 Tax=Paenibacillus humicola TaxID=3110540 RepID=UPI00237BE4CB|nr:CcdC protein domain-containing protein [Paenibacillus humicola]